MKTICQTNCKPNSGATGRKIRELKLLNLGCVVPDVVQVWWWCVADLQPQNKLNQMSLKMQNKLGQLNPILLTSYKTETNL